MCSWYEASARATKGETCADQMTDSFQAHKDGMQFLSQARSMRSAQVLHARAILDGSVCRLRELGDVHDVLGVLGVDHVVPVVLRFLVSW